MIGWGDIYKVVEAMLPLYTALGLGYASVMWWHVFTPEQSDAINKYVSCFAIPLFNLEFTLHIDPFTMNYRFIAADVVAKAITVLVLVAWAACGGKGSLSWSVTSFSLSALNNSLVVGVPLLKSMYGPKGQDLVVQSFVVQALVWLTLLLFALEYRKATAESCTAAGDGSGGVCIELPREKSFADGDGTVEDAAEAGIRLGTRPSFWSLLKVVLLKLASNPNTYGTILGLTWAAVATRWHLKMPVIVEGSVLIMSRAGAGMAMFSMGLFMANQQKLIACGPGLTLFALLLRFIAGPVAMAIGSISVGLRGEVLRIALLQAALPQAITSFVFARQYGLHANVLSTGVIFGTLISLPILIAYYAVLELTHQLF